MLLRILLLAFAVVISLNAQAECTGCGPDWDGSIVDGTTGNPLYYTGPTAIAPFAGCVFDPDNSPNVTCTAQDAAHVILRLKMAATPTGNPFEIVDSADAKVLFATPTQMVSVGTGGARGFTVRLLEGSTGITFASIDNNQAAFHSGSTRIFRINSAGITNEISDSDTAPGFAIKLSGYGMFRGPNGSIGFSTIANQNVTIGGTVQTLLVQDTTDTTGSTLDRIRAGAGQSGPIGSWEDENSNPLTTIDGIATLGTETLDEGNFASHVEWDVTGDFVDSGGNCAYTHSSGVGTCTQIEADLALTPAIANVRYAFTYTISGQSGDAALTITTAFALTEVSLSAADGTFTAYFTSAVAPANFILDGTSASGGITIDDVSLKQIIGGDLVSHGTIRPFVGPLEPYDCTEARWGEQYFDTTDGTMCLCASDGTTEWQKIQDMTTDCSI